MGVLVIEHGAAAFTTAPGLLVGRRNNVLACSRPACARSIARRKGRLTMAAAGDWTELTDAASGNGMHHTLRCWSTPKSDPTVLNLCWMKPFCATFLTPDTFDPCSTLLNIVYSIRL